MCHKKSDSRREFIRKSLSASAAIGSLSVLPSAVLAGRRKAAPSDTINLGLIGCRNMGFNIMRLHMDQPDAQCVALCDVDGEFLDSRTEDVKSKQGSAPRKYTDYRKMLENPDIDAVVIGTPDHWHCLHLTAAIDADKDVYVEKPMANSIAEIEIMTKAANSSNRVVQVGQQQRSGTHWAEIMETIQSGRIGYLRKIKVWGNFRYGVGIPVVQDSNPPSHLDFDFWLGPAPLRSFNASRLHSKWRMFWDYGGGLLTDWGVHLMDMALWAKQVDYMPLSVSAVGGNYSFKEFAHETPDTLSVVYEMKDFVLTWDHTAGTETGPYDMHYGLAFRGDKGTIVANRNGWELKPETPDGKEATQKIPWTDGINYHKEHVRNFLDCVKTREKPNCTVENGRLPAIYTHLGNIAYRTGEKLFYDESRQKITNSKAANRYITPTYRAPWKLPVV